MPPVLTPMQKRQAELNELERRRKAGNKSRQQQTFQAYKERVRTWANNWERYGGKEMPRFGTFRPQTARPRTAMPNRKQREAAANNMRRRAENQARRNEENRRRRANQARRNEENRKRRNQNQARRNEENQGPKYSNRIKKFKNLFSKSLNPRKTYLKLVLNYHPNKGGNQENFKALKNVYEKYYAPKNVS